MKTCQETIRGIPLHIKDNYEKEYLKLRAKGVKLKGRTALMRQQLIERYEPKKKD